MSQFVNRSVNLNKRQTWSRALTRCLEIWLRLRGRRQHWRNEETHSCRSERLSCWSTSSGQGCGSDPPSRQVFILSVDWRGSALIFITLVYPYLLVTKFSIPLFKNMVLITEQLRALPLAIPISVLPAPSWTTLVKSWNASWPAPTSVTINNGDSIEAGEIWGWRQYYDWRYIYIFVCRF